jgi:glycine/D-amino acid oxidase-like deaminating enzyme
MQMIVIGAGVLGSSLAWRLAQRGVQVTLVERSGAAAGTTGSSFAWYNANQKRPEDYFRLNLAGMEAHQALADELDGAPWRHPGGNLVWVAGGQWMDSGEDAGDLEQRVAELQRWTYPAEWLTRAEVAELEPQLVIEESVERIAYFPSEGWVDGPLLAAAMVERARTLGATIRFGCEVTALEQSGERVTGVRLANNELIEGDLIVNCAGPWAGRIAGMAGRALPLAPTLGFVTRVSGVAPGALSRVVHAPEVHLRPDGGGLVALHHYHADAALTAGEEPNAWAETLAQRLRRYLPGAAANARVSRWTVATRPIPADGRTSAGLLPELPGYAEIVTHSAITMGPLLAQLVANELVTGEQSELLANFRPGRFGA